MAAVTWRATRATGQGGADSECRVGAGIATMGIAVEASGWLMKIAAATQPVAAPGATSHPAAAGRWEARGRHLRPGATRTAARNARWRTPVSLTKKGSGGVGGAARRCAGGGEGWPGKTVRGAAGGGDHRQGFSSRARRPIDEL